MTTPSPAPTTSGAETLAVPTPIVAEVHFELPDFPAPWLQRAHRVSNGPIEQVYLDHRARVGAATVKAAQIASNEPPMSALAAVTDTLTSVLLAAVALGLDPDAVIARARREADDIRTPEIH